MAEIHFEGQQNGEKVIFLLRRHPLVLILKVVALFISVVISTIIYIILPIIADDFGGQPWRGLWDLLAILAMMFVWIAFFVVFIDYYLDVWILTNQRIVNIEQKGLFNREIASLSLHKIQDVSMTQAGIIQTLFNYGDVSIQTAGTVSHFIFRQVRDPNIIRKAILKAHRQAEGLPESGDLQTFDADFDFQ